MCEHTQQVEHLPKLTEYIHNIYVIYIISRHIYIRTTEPPEVRGEEFCLKYKFPGPGLTVFDSGT
jgi:hypothetical protein